MEREKLWYIVHTQAGNELKTLYALKKKHIECFCPVTSTVTKTRQKSMIVPLLPNYIFVCISPQEQAAIRQIDGVENFMYWLGDCVVVSEEDIFLLKKLTEKYQMLTAEKIKVNRSIVISKIEEYVPAAVNNDIDEENDLVKVSFPAYGFAITAKENKLNVRVINFNVNRSKLITTPIQHSKPTVRIINDHN